MDYYCCQGNGNGVVFNVTHVPIKEGFFWFERKTETSNES